MMIDGLRCRTELVRQTIFECVQAFGKKNVKMVETPNRPFSIRIRTPEDVYNVEHLTEHTKTVLIQTAGKLGVEYQK